MEMDLAKFCQSAHSVKLAYKIGVFDREYAMNKLAILYATFFGCFTGSYREAMLSDFFIDEED